MLIRTKTGKLKEIIYDSKKLFVYGINKLAGRDYFRSELFRKMKNLQPDDSIINGVLDKLESDGLLDDRRKVRQLMEAYKVRESPKKTLLRIKQKGACEDAINCVLDEISERESLEGTHSNSLSSSEPCGHNDAVQEEPGFLLLQRKFKVWAKEDEPRMFRFLASKMYSSHEISRWIRQFRELD